MFTRIWVLIFVNGASDIWVNYCMSEVSGTHWGIPTGIPTQALLHAEKHVGHEDDSLLGFSTM
jgi:hypothetical protein